MNDSSSAIRVVVADDQVLVRAGVAALLGGLPGIVCTGTADNGEQCLAICDSQPPDVLLLDINMPGLDGLAVTETLHRRQPDIRIVILSSRADPDLARRAIALGAMGYVSKDFVLDELAQALRSVVAGRIYLSPDVALASVQPAAAVALTPRQTDVLRAIARGLSNKEIARELGISVKTVEYHRAEVIQRLDLHDVASLTRYAVAHGLAG